jgi:hypothetical protein
VLILTHIQLIVHTALERVTRQALITILFAAMMNFCDQTNFKSCIKRHKCQSFSQNKTGIQRVHSKQTASARARLAHRTFLHKIRSAWQKKINQQAFSQYMTGMQRISVINRKPPLTINPLCIKKGSYSASYDWFTGFGRLFSQSWSQKSNSCKYL